MKRCPFCAEEIQDAAIVCRFCNADLATNTRPSPVAPTVVAAPASPGVAAVLSLVIPGAGQMYLGSVGQGLAWLLGVVFAYVIFVPFGFLLHVVCVIMAATTRSELRPVGIPASPPRPVAPPPPTQPSAPIPVWQKAVIASFVLLAIGTLMFAVIADRANEGRSGSRYDEVLGDPAKRNRPVRLTQVDARITREGSAWVLTSESAVPWHDCVVLVGGSEYEIPKLYARDVIRVERSQWSRPPADGSEKAFKVMCASQAPN